MVPITNTASMGEGPRRLDSRPAGPHGLAGRRLLLAAAHAAVLLAAARVLRAAAAAAGGGASSATTGFHGIFHSRTIDVGHLVSPFSFCASRAFIGADVDPRGYERDARHDPAILVCVLREVQHTSFPFLNSSHSAVSSKDDEPRRQPLHTPIAAGRRRREGDVEKEVQCMNYGETRA
jgi:hypothetical protein